MTATVESFSARISSSRAPLFWAAEDGGPEIDGRSVQCIAGWMDGEMAKMLKKPGQSFFRFFSVCLVFIFSTAGCRTGVDPYDQLVYAEDFSSLATNGWTDTSDTAQFPEPPSDYSFTLDEGRYAAATSIQTSNTPTCSAVVKQGERLVIHDPYKITLALTFPESNTLIADSIIRFNYYRNVSFESYDYIVLSSDGRFHAGHCSSSVFYHYTDGWGSCDDLKVLGDEKMISICQGSSSFEISVNGKRICYAANLYLPDVDRGFEIGVMRDQEDSTAAGSVSVLYDDIALYK